MVFTTATFALFLVVVFIAYWGIRRRTAQNVLIIAASYFFYGWWDYRYCALMAATSVVDYALGAQIARLPVGDRRRKYWLAGSVISNLGMLATFKYYNFFVASFAVAAGKLGWHVEPVVLHVVLPVGISFYTFQTMSYCLDLYSGRLIRQGTIIDYLAFVSFFPQLVAGPIERASDLLPQFTRPRVFDAESAAEGLRYLLWGLIKKLVIADNLSPIVATAYHNPSAHSGATLAIATVFFAFQIYCDFSGYSDMAIGLGRLFGVRLMRNFAYPYFSQSIAEFWRRWHISLSSWFRDYLYIPLGGSKRGAVMTARNVMLTFVISGLWHGASWNFIIWGALNGAAVLPSSLITKLRPAGRDGVPGGARLVPTLAVAWRLLATFVFVCLTWVFFRAETLSDATAILHHIGAGMTHFGEWRAALASSTTRHGAVLCGAILATEWIARRHPHPLRFEGLPLPARWALYTLLWQGLFILNAYESTPFIYFQF